uniref:G_PROTEIN_RECEP_F1_2 domain-containing protein n=1 Tax=Caenorhabditis tropicalis TaxID=1561998 RepID=A0A1I7V226_9PELO
MDLSLVMHGTIVDTANGTLSHRAAYSMMFAMKLSFDVMSNISFLLLILYRHFKERNPGAKDLHSPIFKQLFIFTTFIVILNAVSLAIRLLWQVGILGDYGSMVALAVVVFVLFYTHSIFFSSIILFSFLAAIQRIVILHWSKYKYLVTGFYLNWLILLVWGITLHYNYVVEYKCNNRPGVEEFICEKLVYKIIYIFYQFLFIAINLLTIWCYWHIKRVISRLTINSERPTIFYHFVPLFTFQNFHINVTLEFDSRSGS